MRVVEAAGRGVNYGYERGRPPDRFDWPASWRVALPEPTRAAHRIARAHLEKHLADLEHRVRAEIAQRSADVEAGRA